VLELAWNGPAVAAALPAGTCVESPDAHPLPFADAAAGAVVLVDPPAGCGAALVAEAARVAARVVVAVADLEAFGARTAAELAPAGWTGREAPGPGDLPLALAHAADSDAALAAQLGPAALGDRERWLELFARGAFGVGERRLWIWRRDEPLPSPERVLLDPALVQPWRPKAAPAPPARRKSPLRRFWERADLVERVRVQVALRRRADRAGA
jgi:hypothetical protein